MREDRTKKGEKIDINWDVASPIHLIQVRAASEVSREKSEEKLPPGGRINSVAIKNTKGQIFKGVYAAKYFHNSGP